MNSEWETRIETKLDRLAELVTSHKEKFEAMADIDDRLRSLESSMDRIKAYGILAGGMWAALLMWVASKI